MSPKSDKKKRRSKTQAVETTIHIRRKVRNWYVKNILYQFLNHQTYYNQYTQKYSYYLDNICLIHFG